MPITVLIVEDNLISAGLFEYYLQKESITTLVACDGLDALELLETSTPDVIVMDVLMPRLNGLHTAKRIKEKAKLSDIPIIMISGSEERNIKTISIDSGADDYLRKPLNEKLFVEKVKFFAKYYDSQKELKKLQKAFNIASTNSGNSLTANDILKEKGLSY